MLILPKLIRPSAMNSAAETGAVAIRSMVAVSSLHPVATKRNEIFGHSCISANHLVAAHLVVTTEPRRVFLTRLKYRIKSKRKRRY